MPKYMLLVYEPADLTPTDEQLEASAPQWTAYTQELVASGHLRGGAPLKPLTTATTVREQGGATQTIDGPFAETKEFLGGFYLVECPDLDAALRHAARCPVLPRGAVEVRPVVDVPGAPA